MALKVPKCLRPDRFFKPDGTPRVDEFPYPLRDAVHYNTTGQIPLTQEPYMIFGDIGVPCNSHLFSNHFSVCNKLYIALQKLCIALAASVDTEKTKFFQEAAELFEALPEFPWPAPNGSVYPTFLDNRFKIAATLRSAALFYNADSKTQVSVLDEIIANTATAEEYKFFNPDQLHDAKFELLSLRACAEADKYFQMCQNDPTPQNVDQFVKNGASAVFLREKIQKPKKELVARIDILIETLQKYHLEAYTAFLKSCAT